MKNRSARGTARSNTELSTNKQTNKKQRRHTHSPQGTLPVSPQVFLHTNFFLQCTACSIITKAQGGRGLYSSVYVVLLFSKVIVVIVVILLVVKILVVLVIIRLCAV